MNTLKKALFAKDTGFSFIKTVVTIGIILTLRACSITPQDVRLRCDSGGVAGVEPPQRG
jgi:hypothetical protein